MARVNYNQLADAEYAIDINWNLRIPATLALQSSFEDLFGTSGYLNIHCKSLGQLPEQLNWATQNIKGIETYQATNINRAGSLSMSVSESDNYRLQEFFNTISKKIVDPITRKIAKKEIYTWKEGVGIDLLDGNGDTQKSFNLKHASFKGWTPQAFGTGTGEIVGISFVLQFSNWDLG